MPNHLPHLSPPMSLAKVAAQIADRPTADAIASATSVFLFIICYKGIKLPGGWSQYIDQT